MVSTAISWVSQAVQPVVQAVVSTARTVGSWVSSGVSRAASWVRARAPVYRAPARRPVPAPVSRGGVSQHCRCAGPRPSGGESIPVEERSGGMTIDVPIRLPTFEEGFSPDPGGVGILIDPIPELWDRISMVFAGGSGSAQPGQAAPEDPRNILMPGGQPIGTPGGGRGVRRLPGGLPAAQALFDRLTRGGTPNTPPTYARKGHGFDLPGGGWVGLRPISESDGSPAIDVNIPGIPRNVLSKIHFP